MAMEMRGGGGRNDMSISDGAMTYRKDLYYINERYGLFRREKVVTWVQFYKQWFCWWVTKTPHYKHKGLNVIREGGL